jgi:hypothetical protein
MLRISEDITFQKIWKYILSDSEAVFLEDLGYTKYLGDLLEKITNGKIFM